MKRGPDGDIIEASHDELSDALIEHHAGLHGLAALVRTYHLQDPDDDGVLCGVAALLDQLAANANDHTTMAEVCFRENRAAAAPTATKGRRS